MIRVLVVLPFYGGSLPIGRYAAKGLVEAGCQVEVFESPAFFSAFSAVGELKIPQENVDFLEGSFLQVVGQAIQAKAESFGADLVLSMAQAPLPRQILKKLSRSGIKTAMWFVEDFRLFAYWRAFAPLYDIFAVIQKEPFLLELQDIGVNNAFYLPLAALPSFHAPVSLSPAEQKRFGSELSFMGAGYPNRRALFGELANYDFKIWGTEWEGESSIERLVQAKGGRVSSEDSVRIFNASKINLNVHSSVRADSNIYPGDFINPRTFEVAACGAFQLVDKRQLMPELFAEDELATFSSKQELKTKIDYFLAHPEERIKIAEKSRARVLLDHTYKKRMESLIEFTKTSFSDWPVPRQKTDWPENISAELKQDLEKLLQDLGLPLSTDFDSVINALRAQEGAFTPLESALLFMDEWKKQYLK